MPVDTAVTLESLPAVLRKQIEALRAPIADIAKKLGVVRESCKDVAPRMMKLFAQIQVERETTNFIDFVRFVDETVPTHADEREGEAGYKLHRTYYAMDYMRRLQRQRPRGRQGVHDVATDHIARTLATLLQVIPAGELWEAFQGEFALKDRQLANMKKWVASAKPFVTLTARAVKVGKVIHMEPTVKATPTAGEQAETVGALRATAASLKGRKVVRRAA